MKRKSEEPDICSFSMNNPQINPRRQRRRSSDSILHSDEVKKLIESNEYTPFPFLSNFSNSIQGNY